MAAENDSGLIVLLSYNVRWLNSSSIINLESARLSARYCLRLSATTVAVQYSAKEMVYSFLPHDATQSAVVLPATASRLSIRRSVCL